MESIGNALQQIIQAIVNFYSEYKEYFDFAQFIAGFVMLFV